MGTGPSPAVVPQYVKIANEIRDKIRNGTYGPGALLPSRNEITAMYGVSAITARDALSMISHEGYAKAVRGRGHIGRRKRSRLTLPSRLYTSAEPDPGVPLELDKLDVYQETPPDNIALPLETADTTVWVRRAVHIAADDRQPIQLDHRPRFRSRERTPRHRPAHRLARGGAAGHRPHHRRDPPAHPRPPRQPLRSRRLRHPGRDHCVRRPRHHLRRRAPPHRALPLHLAHRRYPHQRVLHLHRAGSGCRGTDLRVVIAACELPQEPCDITGVFLDPARHHERQA
jgi:hypothetical protein